MWGCPGYVLSPTLQDGKKIPKWAPKARRGQFLGFSRQHSSTIDLMLNLQTGSISPQFHVVFDGLFTTVHSVDEDNDTWIKLFTSEREYYGPDEEEEDDTDGLTFPELDPNWLPITELPPPAVDVHTTDDAIALSPEPTIQNIPTTDQRSDVTIVQPQVVHPPSNETPPVQTRRIRRPNQRVFGDEWTNHTVQLTPSSRTLLGHIVPNLSHDDLFLYSLDWDAPFSDEREDRTVRYTS